MPGGNGKQSLMSADVSLALRFAESVGDARGVEAADRLCIACVQLLHVDAAAISLVFDGAKSGTLGVSSERARSLDEVQFVQGQGPCVDCVAERRPVFVADLAGAESVRWPAYAAAMLERGICGVYALPIAVAGEYVGGLDLFCADAEPIGAERLAGAAAAAQMANLPVMDLLAEDLQAAVSDPESNAWAELTALSRVEVSQATGVLMAQLDIEPAEALIRLRAYSYAHDRGASEVARDILERRIRLSDE